MAWLLKTAPLLKEMLLGPPQVACPPLLSVRVSKFSWLLPPMFMTADLATVREPVPLRVASSQVKVPVTVMAAGPVSVPPEVRLNVTVVNPRRK